MSKLVWDLWAIRFQGSDRAHHVEIGARETH